MLHIHLRKMSILLLSGGMSCVFLLSLCHLRHCSLINYLSEWFIHWYKWDIKVPYYYCTAIYSSFRPVNICFIYLGAPILAASLVVQMVKNPPTMWDTWIWFLGWEDPLEEGMVTHSSSPSWRIPMDREAWWATVHEVAESCTQLSN